MEFTPEQIEAMKKPLHPSEIEQKDGKDYIAHFAVIRKAFQIFGVGNWCYQIVGDFMFYESPATTKKGEPVYLVSVMVRLRVGDLEFIELGDCEQQGNSVQARSTAMKGAVTDGLKRCLKNFGPAFGLQLYDKHYYGRSRAG